jgi:hypothetical protein
VSFASDTYGTIYTKDRYISFGLNEHGKLIMWLGDRISEWESPCAFLVINPNESPHSWARTVPISLQYWKQQPR